MQILPLARAANLVVQDVDDEVLIYDLITDKALCLNETAAFVWKHCTGKQTVSVIAAQLAKRNDQPVNEDIVWMALKQLDEDNLLSENIRPTNPLAGMNRREVIRKVGLASMIALPVITSLIAPTAAHAQSGGSSSANACNVVGTCYSPGSNICATCAGRRIIYTVYTSGVGCAGGSFGGDTVCPANGTPVTNAFSSLINQVI